MKKILATASLALVAGLAPGDSALADVVVQVPVDAARTYCHNDPLEAWTKAGNAIAGTTPRIRYMDALTGNLQGPTDHSTDDSRLFAPLAVPPFTNQGAGNENVWELIGALGDPNEGEAYCGHLQSAPTLVAPGALGATSLAVDLHDCVGVLRFAIPPKASNGFVHSARLVWNGTNLGNNLTISLAPCEYDGPFAVDGEGADADADGLVDLPDCIVSGDDFAGGTFVGIADVQQRKRDNNTGLIGGTSHIDFLDVFPSKRIELNATGIGFLNEKLGQNAAVIVRCADDSGSHNGFLGGGDNVLVIHDPSGNGFAFPGSAFLELTYSGNPTNSPHYPSSGLGE